MMCSSIIYVDILTCKEFYVWTCAFVFFFLPELMLLGFISLLLTVFQDLISHICISPKHATQMLPCKRSHESLQGSGHDLINYDTIINRRRLFSTDTGPEHCRREVRVGEVYFDSFNIAKCKSTRIRFVSIIPFLFLTRGRYHCYHWKDCIIFTFSSLY
jgi:hypothetical protein